MLQDKYNFAYIIRISFIAALGGLLFGYDWVVIGGAKPFYEKFFNIASNPVLQGWAVSCALVGCVLGSMVSGLLSRRFGRRNLLISSAALFIFSAVGTGLADNFNSFVIYRIIGGIGIGLASNLSPVYIAEVAPSRLRGRFVSLNQLTIVIGILLAQIANWIIAGYFSENTDLLTNISASYGAQSIWRLMFWAEVIPASLFFILMWFVPDSPRWLSSKGKDRQAIAVLQKIGGKDYAFSTFEEIKNSFRDTRNRHKVRLTSRKFLPVLTVGIVLAFFQQWCGINVIFLYAEEVFTSAGYSVSDMLFNVVITGSVNLIFTLIAMKIVDKVGRKKLMIAGSIGLTIIYAFIGTFYYMGFQGLPLLILIVTAIACYAMTLAPVVWVILSEIFPNKIRGAAMAVSTFTLWVSNALLAYLFPVINSGLEVYGSFWFFSIVCFLGFVFIHFRVKETKGKSLETIEKEWNL